ncbi:MAG: hypothetical protein AAF579_14295 [Cyanobacteria bacterium P01_C01_bin.118]
MDYSYPAAIQSYQYLHQTLSFKASGKTVANDTVGQIDAINEAKTN